MYFFMSACIPMKKLGPDSLDWEVLQPRSDDAEAPVRQRTCSLVMSKMFEDLPLESGNGQHFYEYDYYISLLLHDAWRVPVLYGRVPRCPDAEASPSEKGLYALVMLVLFKPHRHPQDLLDFVFRGARVQGSLDNAWGAMYKSFEAWRKQDIDGVAARFIKSAKRHPQFGTVDWWACIISEKMRQYDMIYKKHTSEQMVTQNLSMLPEDVPLHTSEGVVSTPGELNDSEEGGSEILEDIEPRSDGSEGDGFPLSGPQNQQPSPGRGRARKAIEPSNFHRFAVS